MSRINFDLSGLFKFEKWICAKMIQNGPVDKYLISMGTDIYQNILFPFSYYAVTAFISSSKNILRVAQIKFLCVV